MNGNATAAANGTDDPALRNGSKDRSYSAKLIQRGLSASCVITDFPVFCFYDA